MTRNRKPLADLPIEDLLTPGEVAALFRVDPKTVRRWVDSGLIDCFRTPGGHRRYRRAQILAVIRDRR